MSRNPSNVAKANKAKGRNFQKSICKLILDAFPDLTPDDVRSNPMGSNGEDLLISSTARRLLGSTQHECKTREKLAMSEWMDQASSHGDYEPLLWFRKGGRGQETYVCMKADFYLRLLKGEVDGI